MNGSTPGGADGTRPGGPLTERSPRVVAAVKLHRSAERRKRGLFLAEGANAFASALAAGAVVEMFCTTQAAARNGEALAEARAAGVGVRMVTERAAQRLADTVTPQGIVGLCRLLDVGLAEALERGGADFIVVAVSVSDPGNAGTIVRIADAMGASAVVFAGDCVDPHNGKCVRASAGSVFHLPVVRERDVAAVLAALRSRGVRILATAADGETDLDGPGELLSGPVAWVFGNEAHGLDGTVAAAASHRVRIPIAGRAESLNLATSAAICLYETARRRAGRAPAADRANGAIP